VTTVAEDLRYERERLRHLLSAAQAAVQSQLPMREWPNHRTASGRRAHKQQQERERLLQQILDPELNLRQVALLLGVCPATVRRYTNRGLLGHLRTPGNQRRFRLSHVLAFVSRAQDSGNQETTG